MNTNVEGQSVSPNDAKPLMVTCSECDGTGKVYYSCCGDDVKGTLHEDYGICPTCKEHLSGEHEDCESCNGTGTELAV